MTTCSQCLNIIPKSVKSQRGLKIEKKNYRGESFICIPEAIVQYEFKKPFDLIRHNLMSITVNFQKNKPIVLVILILL